MSNEIRPILHLIPAFTVTVKRQISHAAAAFVGGIGALLSMPTDTWLPHLSAIFGPRAKDWGPFLMAIAFFWNFAMKGKDAQTIHQQQKSSTEEKL